MGKSRYMSHKKNQQTLHSSLHTNIFAVALTDFKGHQEMLLLPESATVRRPPVCVTFPQAKASTSMLVGICPDIKDCLSHELHMPDSGLEE